MIVADTTLIAYLVLPGPRSEVARRVFQQDPAWRAPVLWQSEMRNVIATGSAAGRFSTDEGMAALEVAEDVMRGGAYLMPPSAVMEVVDRSGLSAYDGEFVALAEALGTRLVTSDQRVLGACPEVAIRPEESLA